MQFRKMSGCIRQRSVYEQALCRACSGLIDLNEFRGLSGLAARKGASEEIRIIIESTAEIELERSV